MRTLLAFTMFAIWLPVPGHGMPPEPGTSSNPEMSSRPGMPSGHSTLSATGSTNDAELSQFPARPHTPSISTTLKSLSSTSIFSSYALQKCCPRGEYASSYAKCAPLVPSIGNGSDPWWWIAPGLRQNLSLETLPEDDVSYGRMPCGKNQRVFIAADEVVLHRHRDGIRLEVAVETASSSSSSNETTHVFNSDSFCLDVTSAFHIVVLCPCVEMLCLRKCCALSLDYDPETRKCVVIEQKQEEERGNWLPGFDKNWKMDDKYFLMAHADPACAQHEMRKLVNDTQSNLNLTFMKDGRIKSQTTGALYHRDRFCGDRSPSGVEIVVTCQVSPSSQEMAMSTALTVLLAIGSLALLLTVLVSCLLPDTRKRLHGRMALVHNVMLLIAYVSTGALHVIAARYSMSTTTSKVTSFVIQFSFLSAFFWLNVMCIDIALVFKGLRPVPGSALQQDERKFAYYSTYAWGSTCLISLVTAAVEFTPGASLRPAFGETNYFFNNDGAMLLFFYGPMAILLAVNLALFVYTAIKIKMAAQESNAVLDSTDSKTTRKNKYRLAVYAKLSTLMGVTWVFEVVSWAVGGDPRAWFLTDAANLLRAVFVFVIFCCNKHVYQLLKLRAQPAFDCVTSTVCAGVRATSRHPPALRDSQL